MSSLIHVLHFHHRQLKVAVKWYVTCLAQVRLDLVQYLIREETKGIHQCNKSRVLLSHTSRLAQQLQEDLPRQEVPPYPHPIPCSELGVYLLDRCELVMK